MKKRLTLLALVLGLLSCTQTMELEQRLDKIAASVAALEEQVAQANGNAIAVGKFLRDGQIRILFYEKTEQGYVMELSDGSVVSITFGSQAAGIVPLLLIDENGAWTVSLDGGQTFTPVAGAASAFQDDGVTPQLRIGEGGYWEVSLDGGESYQPVVDSDGRKMSATDGMELSGKSSVFEKVVYDDENSAITFTLLDGRTVTVPVVDNFYLTVKGYTAGKKIALGDAWVYAVESSGVASVIISASEGWSARLGGDELSVTAPLNGMEGDACTVDILIVSEKGWLRHIPLQFMLSTAQGGKTGVKTWDDWVSDSAENLLPDFSYAGFDHGESVPADALSLGYTVYNVMDYGAIPDDGQSDRQAVLLAYQAAIGAGNVHNPNARAVLYFPEGEFILHTSADNIDGKSSSILMRAGAFVIKGAGRDKTTLVMQDPNLPESDALYSSPVMVELKHNSGLTELGKVTADAAKGSFSVTVDTPAGIAAGDWVCLQVINNDAAFVAAELAPYAVESSMTNLIGTGVQVWDYHQVKSVSGNVVTFREPILHAVQAQYGWALQKYPHYEMVGVEDLTFKGNAKDDFKHHGSWADDGAYKPLAMTRITNGWLRRVRFTSVSEACTITNSANVSAYDIEIDGKRGHSSIRSQQSSRVFIGKVLDHSDGPLVNTGAFVENAGQYHAVGVSKPSLGTVLWRNVWGKDGCFEAHATQPRATLLDACEGGWMQFRQGGDDAQVPNHLGDLVIWNFKATTPYSGSWDWWKSNSLWWKFLPPVIVGFHGENCSFDPAQTLVDESHGTPADPESLYEAQLKHRLGAVPSWLNAIK